MRSKIVTGFVTSVVLAGLGTFAAGARDAGSFRVAISFPAAKSAQPIDGRVLLFISDDGRTEPRLQSDQYRANSTRPIFGVDVDGMKPDQDVVIDQAVFGWPLHSVRTFLQATIGCRR